MTNIKVSNFSLGKDRIGFEDGEIVKIKTKTRMFNIKVGGRWVDCLIIGEYGEGYFAVDMKDVPKSALKVVTK